MAQTDILTDGHGNSMTNDRVGEKNPQIWTSSWLTEDCLIETEDCRLDTEDCRVDNVIFCPQFNKNTGNFWVFVVRKCQQGVDIVGKTNISPIGNFEWKFKKKCLSLLTVF